MSNLQNVAEPGGLAEDYVLPAGRKMPPQLPDAFEPYTVECGCSVGKEAYQAHRRAFAKHVEADKTAAELQLRILAGILTDFADCVCAAPVNIARREVMQEVVGRMQIELRAEKFCFLRPDAFHIGYVEILQREHGKILFL